MNAQEALKALKDTPIDPSYIRESLIPWLEKLAKNEKKTEEERLNKSLFGNVSLEKAFKGLYESIKKCIPDRIELAIHNYGEYHALLDGHKGICSKHRQAFPTYIEDAKLPVKTSNIFAPCYDDLPGYKVIKEEVQTYGDIPKNLQHEYKSVIKLTTENDGAVFADPAQYLKIRKVIEASGQDLIIYAKYPRITMKTTNGHFVGLVIALRVE